MHGEPIFIGVVHQIRILNGGQKFTKTIQSSEAMSHLKIKKKSLLKFSSEFSNFNIDFDYLFFFIQRINFIPFPTHIILHHFQRLQPF